MNHTQEFIDMLRTCIILWAHKSLSYILYHKEDPITHHHELEIEISIWNQVFDELLPQMKYLIGIHRGNGFKYMNQTSSVRLFEKETIQEYIDKYADFKKIGPYDYIEFQKNMKNADFVEQLKVDYTNYENNKMIKNDIVSGVYGYMTNEKSTIELINAIPFYEYISQNNILLDEEPLIANFRTKKPEFYELYTLWHIKQYLS